MKRSLFGRSAAGNPSFVAQLRRDLFPTLATARRVRTWMTNHASAAELREIRSRTGPVPCILSGIPATGGVLPLERPARPEAQASNREEPLPRGAGLCEHNRGGGPAFHRFGGRVRYRGEDLKAWAAERRTRLAYGSWPGQIAV